MVFFEMAQLNAEGKFKIPVPAPLIIFSRKDFQFKRTRAGCQCMQSSNLIILSPPQCLMFRLVGLSV